MVDVLVRPGVPKPWLASALQKELPSSCGFISGCFSPFNLTHLALDELISQYPCISNPHLQPNTLQPHTSQARTSHTSRVEKSPTIRKKKGKSRRDSPAMSHNPLAMGYHITHERYLFTSENVKDSKSNAGLSQPARSGPAINPMGFGNRDSTDGMEYKYMKNNEQPFTADAGVEVPHPVPVPVLDISWTDRNSSFVSKNEDTPSLISSFDMMDPPNEDVSLCHGLPYLPTGISSHTVDGVVSQQSQEITFPSHGLWTPWPTGEVDLWRQQFGPEHPAWSIPEDLYHPWHSSASVISSGLIPSPSTQPYYSPLSPHSIPVFTNNRQAPSTPTINEPDQEIPASIAKIEPGISSVYQGGTYPVYPSSASSPGLNNGAFPHQSSSGGLYHQGPTQGSTTDLGTPNSSPQSLSSAELSIRANFHYSDSRNAFLIECKRRGLSYKDIKRLGGFKEAESTLRGRFRTLTKSKEQRVRKPKWSDTDVCILSFLSGLGVGSNPFWGMVLI